MHKLEIEGILTQFLYFIKETKESLQILIQNF